jgi:hypothetical protein
VVPPVSRFLVFAGDNYYPCGGWQDFVSGHDSLESARAVTDFRYTEHWREGEHQYGGLLAWVHIVDRMQIPPKIVFSRQNHQEKSA